jgi:hypothetical protein
MHKILTLLFLAAPSCIMVGGDRIPSDCTCDKGTSESAEKVQAQCCADAAAVGKECEDCKGK